MPKPTLILGANVYHDQVQEGSDVTFECHVMANPPVVSVTWQFNGRPLSVSNSNNQLITMLNHTLILRNVSRHQSGDYRCFAANLEGEGSSQELHLKVLCRFINVLYSINVGSTTCF